MSELRKVNSPIIHHLINEAYTTIYLYSVKVLRSLYGFDLRTPEGIDGDLNKGIEKRNKQLRVLIYPLPYLR
jgi:hypothetical protein